MVTLNVDNLIMVGSSKQWVAELLESEQFKVAIGDRLSKMTDRRQRQAQVDLGRGGASTSEGEDLVGGDGAVSVCGRPNAGAVWYGGTASQW